MSDYTDTVRRHRRLAILRHLELCVEYASNASILQSVLNGLGLRASTDELITELAWLREQGFVEFDDRADFLVVTATRRGVEIAQGTARHPLIQRPGPRI